MAGVCADPGHLGRLGVAWRGPAWRGTARRGEAWQAWYGYRQSLTKPE